jgi:hypothetical protein
MNTRFVAFFVIISNYLNYANGIISQNERQQRLPIMKCYSSPDLRMLYNSTFYTSHTISFNNDINNKPVHYDKYKSIIHNKYKRNIYLRSKEKYIGDVNK